MEDLQLFNFDLKVPFFQLEGQPANGIVNVCSKNALLFDCLNC